MATAMARKIAAIQENWVDEYGVLTRRRYAESIQIPEIMVWILIVGRDAARLPGEGKFYSQDNEDRLR